VRLFQVSTTHPAIPTAPVRRPRGCSKEGPLQSAIPARFCSKEAKSGAADRKVRSSPPSPPSPRGSALVSQSPPPLSSLGRHHGRSAHQPRRSHQPRPTHQPRKSPTCRKSPPSIHGSRANRPPAANHPLPSMAAAPSLLELHGRRAPTEPLPYMAVAPLPSKISATKYRGCLPLIAPPPLSLLTHTTPAPSSRQICRSPRPQPSTVLSPSVAQVRCQILPGTLLPCWLIVPFCRQ
jgi:hypothetical protein